MIHSVLGKTNLVVSRLAYGGSPLGNVFGPVDDAAAIASVHAALDAGINLFDTAPYYGNTRAETMLGRALKGVSRDGYLLATKVGRYGLADFDFSAKRVERSVDESLRRLGVEHVDFIQAHDIEFGDITEVIEQTVPALQRIKAAGKARFVGITGLPVHLFPQVMDAVEVDQVQSYCHYTLADTALTDVLPYLRAKNVGIFNAAPLAMRLLTDEEPPDWHPAPAALRERCALAAAFCRARSASLADLALQFSVRHPDIHTHIVGGGDPARVRANIQVAFAPIDEELLAGVLEILRPVHNRTWPSGRPENSRPLRPATVS